MSQAEGRNAIFFEAKRLSEILLAKELRLLFGLEEGAPLTGNIGEAFWRIANGTASNYEKLC